MVEVVDDVMYVVNVVFVWVGEVVWVDLIDDSGFLLVVDCRGGGYGVFYGVVWGRNRYDG